MGKSRRAFKEHTKEQELLHENSVLKKEIGRLRKLLSKSHPEEGVQIDEITEEKYKPFTNKSPLDQLKEEWKCNGTPGCEGYLEIIKFNKIDKEHYFRQCNSCRHRTRSQKWTDSVRGIIKKS